MERGSDGARKREASTALAKHRSFLLVLEKGSDGRIEREGVIERGR
jgi:hypothetical protein